MLAWGQPQRAYVAASDVLFAKGHQFASDATWRKTPTGSSQADFLLHDLLDVGHGLGRGLLPGVAVLDLGLGQGLHIAPLLEVLQAYGVRLEERQRRGQLRAAVSAVAVGGRVRSGRGGSRVFRPIGVAGAVGPPL